MEDFVKANIQLPSPPSVAIRILEAVKREDSSIDELAKVIATDPALTSRALKIVNSSLYGLPNKVASVKMAVNFLGVEAIKNIALSFVVMEQWRQRSENGFDFDLFWRRALTAAVAAEIVAAQLKQHSEDLFVTALLQDIGVIIMYLSRPNDYVKVFDHKRSVGGTVTEAERRIFGFDHQALGAKILQSWGLPASVGTAVKHHHNWSQAPQACRQLAQIIAMSDELSSVYHGNHCVEKARDISAVLTERHGFAEKETSELIDTVAEKSIEVFSYFSIDPGSMKPFSVLLQEANAELGKLNLSYEQLLMELKKEKEKVENLARELVEANKKLKQMAVRDGLTGLYNHRYFQEAIEKELKRARRYETPFSLIMFDLDYFKKINDTFGHPAGDLVLQKIGQTATQLIRETDTVARYGGEEFALLLPNTAIEGAVIVAERLRQLAAKLDVSHSGQSIKVTISLGVTAYTPGTNPVGKEDLIAVADKALYRAKKAGRNRLCAAHLRTTT